MTKRSRGIHHITAIVGHPQENVDFYAGVLGLRLVKRTVNFDDPGTYHLYFGDETGSPGTIMTFFPWPEARRGRIGAGQAGITPFVVPPGSLDYWKERLHKRGVSVMEGERFGEPLLQFDDPHGLRLELVARAEGEPSRWTWEDISTNQAIKGFGGAVLYSGAPQKTMDLLTQGLGLAKEAEDEKWVRYRASDDIGNVIDVKKEVLPAGTMGAGVVHHIAWRAADEADHQAWRDHVQSWGMAPTPIVDRQYFQSIYFREEGGILFEIATDQPGFAWDENQEQLGESLKLPPWLEPQREQIESVLLPVKVGKREGGGK